MRFSGKSCTEKGQGRGLRHRWRGLCGPKGGALHTPPTQCSEWLVEGDSQQSPLSAAVRGSVSLLHSG